MSYRIGCSPQPMSPLRYFPDKKAAPRAGPCRKIRRRHQTNQRRCPSPFHRCTKPAACKTDNLSGESEQRTQAQQNNLSFDRGSRRDSQGRDPFRRQNYLSSPKIVGKLGTGSAALGTTSGAAGGGGEAIVAVGEARPGETLIGAGLGGVCFA